MILALAATLLVCLAVRFAFVLRTPTRKRSQARRVLVVLGSGGHTSEMVNVLRQLPKEEWASKTVVYVASATDNDSRGVAEGFEMAFLGRNAVTAVIPRAREVGQSYFTSVFTTLRACGSALLLVLDQHPDTILTNGPGVRIPVVAANLLLSTLFLGRQRATMAYFESFTCVDHVSLSGKIMLLLADVLTVEWPALATKLRGKGFKQVVYAGRFPADGALAARDAPALLEHGTLGVGKATRTCIVTVGSTKFDDLIRGVDTPEFFDAVTDIGINHVVIQKGRSDVDVSAPFPKTLMTREVFDYRPGLPAAIRSASLVISHAGAGTILEALNAGVPTIVVPNARLMSNHQLQLAEALSERNYLHFAYAGEELIRTLRGVDAWTRLKRFPPPNSVALRKALLPILE